MFNELWLEDDVIGEWISKDEVDPSRAFCKICRISLRGRYGDLRAHATSKRHLIGKGDVSSISSVRVAPKIPAKRRPASKARKKPSHAQRSSNVKNTELCVYSEGARFQPADPSMFVGPDNPSEYFVAAAPGMHNENSVIPVSSEHYLPPHSTNEPSFGPSAGNHALRNYYYEETNDLNYLFGLYIGAGLKKCTEEQASISRLKIQAVMHQATLGELQL